MRASSSWAALLTTPAGTTGKSGITGPSDANIAEDIEMLERGRGVLQVADMVSCWREISALLSDRQRAEALGRGAQARLSRQPDIVQRYMDEITPFL